MLSVSTLMAAQTIFTNAFSPSVNPCMKRVAATRFRHDPYNARVIPASALLRAIAESPAARKAVLALQRSPQHTRAEAMAPMVKLVPVAPTPAATSAASPKVPSSAPRYATVQFKHSTALFLAPFRITAGDLVVVDGDRGEDIGTVTNISTATPAGTISNKIVRRAHDKDREMLATQRAKEREAVDAIQALANTLRLNATIEDAEYQFDMNKLTVFVRRASKSVFVDFRKLQRGLFREFRCRIWCAYMDEVEN